MPELARQFFRVANLEKFQHYRDRKPPWIKLYRDLWRDPRFFALDEVQRYHLISLFVLASQNDNLLHVDQKWLKHEMATTKPIDLKTLIDTGWVEYVEQDASKMLAASALLAGRKHLSIVETETETETPIVPVNGDGVVDRFEAFWIAYPRKVGKGAALKIWTRIKPSAELTERMLTAVHLAKQSEQWKKENGRFIPHLATWLNQGRWDDEPIVAQRGYYG